MCRDSSGHPWCRRPSGVGRTGRSGSIDLGRPGTERLLLVSSAALARFRTPTGLALIAVALTASALGGLVTVTQTLASSFGYADGLGTTAFGRLYSPVRAFDWSAIAFDSHPAIVGTAWAWGGGHGRRALSRALRTFRAVPALAVGRG